MFTSDDNSRDMKILKHSLGNFAEAAFCVLFGAVYEAFSFGVFSFAMIYAFVFPFIVGVFLMISYMRGKTFGRMFLNLLNSAAATAAFGALAWGVVEIYGSENRLLMIYPFAVGALLIAAAAALIADKVRAAKAKKAAGIQQ